MASFTDNVEQLTKFNPYIAQQPVQEMAGVGVAREQQFQEGIQKVQGYVDNLLGLAISKPETQEYVKQRVGQLQGAVSQSIAGDFSDQRLTNQIGGLAGKIASDPIIQNGVRSTAAVQSGFSQIEEARKSGKGYGMQNEAKFQELVGKWQNDKDVTTSFNGTYTPYTDIMDEFQKAFKEAHPGEDIPNDAYRYDEHGNVTINPVLFKGVGADRVQSIWNLVASKPNVQAQLGIDGWYNYRGYTPEMLGKELTDQTNGFLSTTEKAVRTLQAKMVTEGANAKDIGAQIEALKQQAANKKTKFSAMSNLLIKNPEGYKTQLATEALSNNLIGAYAYGVMEKSPLWETSLEEGKFREQMRQFNVDYDFKVKKENFDERLDLAKLDVEQQKLEIERQKAAKTAKTTAGGTPYIVTSGSLNTAESTKTSQTAADDIKDAEGVYIQDQRRLASQLVQDKQPYVLDENNVWIPNVGKGPKQYESKEVADRAAYDALGAGRDSYINGKSGDAITKELMDNAQHSFDVLQSKRAVVDEVNKLYGPEIKKIKDALPPISIPTESGKDVTSEDLADVWISKSGKAEAEAAKKRLQSKFGSFTDNVIARTSSKPAVGFGAGVQVGDYQDQYNKIAGVLSKDKNIAVALDNIDNEYKKRQSVENYQTVTYSSAKPEEKLDNATNYYALLSAYKSLNPTSTKGDVNDLLATLAPGSDPKNFADNQYQATINSKKGTVDLKVGRANGNVVQVTIPYSTYLQVFKDQRVDNTFRNNFGARLDLNQGRYTGTERTEGYVVTSPSGDNTIQYNLVKQGAGDYGIRWWVTDKSNPDKPIINGEWANGTIPGMPAHMSEEDVIAWTKKFNDEAWLKLILAGRPKK